MAVKVSVVVPVYNYAHYLDGRMASLLAQTYTDLEIIAVDDGSQDDSRAVLQKYAGDPRVRTLWFDQNGGQPYLRWNDGAAIAHGEYFLFAGADDLCEPTMVERLAVELDRHADVGIAHARSWIIDANGRRVSVTPSGERWDRDFLASGAEEAPFLVVRNTMPNASAMLLRRTIFEQCGRFDPSLRLCADWMLYARMLTVSRMAYVAEPLNYFRKHQGTLRRSQADHLLVEQYRVLEYLLDSFAIPGEVAEHARNHVAEQWARRLLSSRSVRDFDVNRRVYQVARTADRRLTSRMARMLGRRLYRAVAPAAP